MQGLIDEQGFILDPPKTSIQSPPNGANFLQKLPGKRSITGHFMPVSTPGVNNIKKSNGLLKENIERKISGPSGLSS